ncbi:cation transporter, partial [Streptomyces vinaceus]|uniref:cation transporter n=1 Tax=Streptomyces vinaceus TaxID=1960 RepID=UPI0036837448
MSSSTVHDGPIAAAGAAEVELAIGGMTCASCAARIEKKLNRMDGVTATVNYATEKARVSYGDGVQVADLIATVVKTGYTAEEPPPPEPGPEPAAEAAPPPGGGPGAPGQGGPGPRGEGGGGAAPPGGGRG